MKNKVELFIKSGNSFVAVDVLDFPYRLNRVAFSTSSDKLKTLGGTTSTQIKLAKSKKNNQAFLGRTDFKSVGKFNNFRDFEAKILENGAQSAIGVFKLEAVTSKEFAGTFYDNDANWIDQLGNIKLNELGYVDGAPTWLVPWNGTISINAVNDLSNRETDFVCPLIQYNNTPILDYLDLTNEQIFELDKQFPRDFELKKGYFGTRLGLNCNDILPAIYYRNILERIFAEVGLSVECPLFYEPWFNALILPYVGNKEYQFNWKNIASVYSENPFVQQIGEANVDEIKSVASTISPADGLALNKADLPLLGGGGGTTLWITEETFRFKQAQIIKHDDWDNTLVEKISLVNNFNTFNQYLVPADGNYTIEVNSQIESEFEDFIELYSGGPGGAAIWLGATIYNAFGTWDANSNTGDLEQDHFGWDDNVLIVLRRNQSDSFNYAQTEQDLYEWLNGQNTKFTDIQNDVIAYFDPKRWQVNETYGGVASNQISGCPMSNFENNVELIGDFAGHQVLSVVGNKTSRSWAHIKVDADLKKGERIEIFWLSLANVSGTVALDPAGPPLPTSDAALSDSVYQRFGTDATAPDRLSEYSISYNCGQYDLDLAANLPNITAKEFVASFINLFNLHFFREGKTVQFTPISQYYSPEIFDITPRVDWGRGWESQPIATPKRWVLGYDVDNNDKLLAENFDICTGQNKRGVANYGNITIENQNAYADGQINDLVLFSSTKFIDVDCRLADRVLNSIFLPSETDPSTGFVLQTGIAVVSAIGEILGGLKIPSIQSAESEKTKLFGDLNRSFDYTPRLLYHLGTANQYYGLDAESQLLIGYPRCIVDGVIADDFIRKAKHWFRPTISQFDLENSVQAGIEYPTLRFDTANGLYSRYFENLIELYNLSEQFTIQVAIRASDWANLKGYKKIRFQDQLYRLMEVKDYDPVTKEVCTVILLKEV